MRMMGCLVAVALAMTALEVEAQERDATAVRVSTAPRIDGALSDSIWQGIEPVTGFRQRDPVDGAPASERTEVRIAYDDEALYFGFMLYDSEPDLIRRNILQRGGRIDKDDRVVIALDTYFDRRNGYIFELGALGTQDDALFSDESLTLDEWSWDGVFTSETSVTDEGWILEVAIPFATIRFSDVDAPRMGIAFQRSIRRKNENVFWPHIGQDYRSGIAQVSQYATLDGLRGVQQGRHIEIKPYAIAGAQDNAGAEPDQTADAGFDVKYGITSNATLDLTLNTDFAQVEADNVQINLTRFNLFFPEKREFFLERAGLFQFGAPRETEVFFSRRVGLETDILGGGRLTGQVGKFSIGTMSLRTGALDESGAMTPAAWNNVARIRGDLRPRTTLGGIATSLDTDVGYNRVAGIDFDSRFWSSSSFRFWAANVWDSEHREEQGSTAAAQAELVLQNDLYMVEVSRTRVGPAFDPALGFVPRNDQARWGIQAGVRPRFEQSGWARQLSVFVRGNRIEGYNGVKQSHFRSADAAFSFESGERTNVEVSERFEHIEKPVRISGREVPPGDYSFQFVSGGFRTNDSREFSASANWSVGEFWSGTRASLGTGAVWKTGPHLSLGGDVRWNDVSLPVEDGDFSTTLVSLDIQGAVSRKLFANALVQWDDVSNSLQANIRVDWIHTPGSDLFVVIDTGYLTGGVMEPLQERWTRRTGVMKLTYLFPF